MDGPEGHFSKWNKSDINRHILYIFTYMYNLKKEKKTQIKRDQIQWLPLIRCRGLGNWIKLVKRFKLPIILYISTWGVIYSMRTIVNIIVWYIWTLLGANPKSLHCKEKNIFLNTYKMIDANQIYVVIISQYV